MKYLIINPYYNASHGIQNYINNLKEFLEHYSFNGENIELEVLENRRNQSIKDFQKTVYNYVTLNYGTDEVIIEAPEARAATLLLPKDYKVHLRIHCPLYIAQKFNGNEPNQDVYSQELRVMHKAHLVSSPSYGVIDEMKDEIDHSDIAVYKNPYNKNIKFVEYNEKEFDVVFMGRFQKLKGIEYLNGVLERLPEHFRVLIIGKDSTKFEFSNNIKCNLTIKEEIRGEERFHLIGKSKMLLLLSRFENCSMVILESLAAGTVVAAWDVGGNAEIASPDVLRILPFEDIHELIREIIYICSTLDYPVESQFAINLDEIENDFYSGFKYIIDSFTGNRNERNYRGMNKKHLHKPKLKNNSNYSIDNLYEAPFGNRILGFSISNEHIEEMWEPIVRALNLEVKYICRRPLGYHTIFDKTYPINSENYIQYDWIKDVSRLIRDIKSFSPDRLLFHNGLHPMYQEVLKEVKKLGIPIIYSELGWFPQKNNIYLDRWGTNGKSFLASLSAEELCNQIFIEPTEERIEGEYVLVATQLENDTNLIINSPKFKKNINFVSHVISEIPEKEKVIIKVHPKDKNWIGLKKFEDERIQVVKDDDIDLLLKNAKAVIGINSTVLIQALKYNINIYTFGFGLLDNKGVTISCINDSLSGQWTDKLIGSRERREAIIRAFKERQINVKDIEQLSINTFLDSPAFEPLRYRTLSKIAIKSHPPNPVVKPDKLFVIKKVVKKVLGKKLSKKVAKINSKIKKRLNKLRT